jgi:hypothetical protein
MAGSPNAPGSRARVVLSLSSTRPLVNRRLRIIVILVAKRYRDVTPPVGRRIMYNSMRWKAVESYGTWSVLSFHKVSLSHQGAAEVGGRSIHI